MDIINIREKVGVTIIIVIKGRGVILMVIYVVVMVIYTIVLVVALNFR